MRREIRIVPFLLMITTSLSLKCEDLHSFLVCHNGTFEQLKDQPDILQRTPDRLILNNFNGIINLNNLRVLNRVERLSINFGSFVEIEPESFRATPNLKQLSLRSNTTNQVIYNRHILSKFRHLESLDLDGGLYEDGALNNLRIYRSNLKNIKFPRVISKATFGKLRNLEEFDISDSELANIGEDAFSGLANLRQLFLCHVKLETISSGAFNNLVNLKELILAGNRIRYLSWDSFTGLKSLEVLNLKKNPLDNFNSEENMSKIQRITPQLRDLFITCPAYLTEDQKYFMDLKMRHMGLAFYCTNE